MKALLALLPAFFLMLSPAMGGLVDPIIVDPVSVDEKVDVIDSKVDVISSALSDFQTKSDKQQQQIQDILSQFETASKKQQEEIQQVLNRVSDRTPQVRMSMGGTEYLPNDDGRVFVFLLNTTTNRPINDADCFTTIYRPDNSLFLDSQAMTFLDEGIFYHDFTVPDVIGNYITDFRCQIPTSAGIFSQNKSFSVSLNTSGVNSNFAFDNSNNNTILSAYTMISFNQSAGGRVGYVLNKNITFNSSGGAGGTSNITLSTRNFTVGTTQPFNIRRTGGGTAFLFWVNLVVNFNVNNGTNLTFVRGQTEVHVRSDLSYLQNVNSTLFNKNFSADFTATNSLITDSNSTLFNSILNNTNLLIKTNTTLFNAILNDTNLKIAINQSLSSLIVQVNGTLNQRFNLLETLIYSVNSTVNSAFASLSNMMTSHDISMANNFTLVNQKLNSLDISMFNNFTFTNSEVNQVASEVWTFPTRTLTEINLTNVTLTGNITVALPPSTLQQIAQNVYDYFWRASVFDREQNRLGSGFFGGFTP